MCVCVCVPGRGQEKRTHNICCTHETSFNGKGTWKGNSLKLFEERKCPVLWHTRYLDITQGKKKQLVWRTTSRNCVLTEILQKAKIRGWIDIRRACADHCNTALVKRKRSSGLSCSNISSTPSSLPYRAVLQFSWPLRKLTRYFMASSIVGSRYQLSLTLGLETLSPMSGHKRRPTARIKLHCK